MILVSSAWSSSLSVIMSHMVAVIVLIVSSVVLCWCVNEETYQRGCVDTLSSALSTDASCWSRRACVTKRGRLRSGSPLSAITVFREAQTGLWNQVRIAWVLRQEECN